MNKHMLNAVEIRDLTVKYHKTVALKKADVNIPAGSFTGVIGMNGAGKSTLFKAIMGLARPDKGDILVSGIPPKQAQRLGLVAYVPQSELVDWDFPVSVYDVVMMGRYGTQNIFKTPREKDHIKVEESLKKVGMFDLRDRQIGELSGGQKKRVFIARALAQEAEILLLDEPFAGVDAQSELYLTNLLGDLNKEGKTIIMSTHELTSLSEYCDHVVLVKNTVIAYGPTEEVFTHDLVSQTFDGAIHRINFKK
jgi:ABC-type Mn2+/Zn2+ transport system ATPase subunit